MMTILHLIMAGFDVLAEAHCALEDDTAVLTHNVVVLALYMKIEQT